MTNPLEPTGDFEPRSSAAKAILDAYFTHADLLNRDVSHEEMLAAAIRVLADQVVPEQPTIPEGDLTEQTYRWDERSGIRADILAIANELDGCQK